MRYSLLEKILFEFKIRNGFLEIVEIDLVFEVFLDSIRDIPPKNGGDKYPRFVSKVDKE